MLKQYSLTRRLSQWVFLSICLVITSLSYGQQVQEDPSALAMAGDLVVARPLLLATTVVGSVLFIASLPFSIPGGNVKQTGKVLVGGPAKQTFTRCLGCPNSGYQKTMGYE